MPYTLSNSIYLSLFTVFIMLSCNVAAEDTLANQIPVQTESTLNITCTEEDEELEEDIVEYASQEDESTSMDVESESSFFSFLDVPQKFISSGVEELARNIDEFFSDDKVFYESSGTYLRLRADTIVHEAGNTGYQGDIKLKLRLPHAKRKLKLTFESDIDQRQEDVTGQPENTPIAAIEEKDYFAGLQATLGRKDEWQFKPSIGVRLGSGFEPYVRFRARRKYEFDNWSIRWHETPYWFDSFGWGFDSYLEFNNKLTNDSLFRAATFARWTREIDKFELSQTFTMYHTLSKRRALSYFIGAYGESEPTVHATHYLVGATYRQNIHKDYLFLEIIPQIRYEKINDFHSEHSLVLRVEMVFRK